jgi:hypothetical protein
MTTSTTTPMTERQQDRYLNPHQARQRPSTPHEDLLGDSIERAFAAGIHDLDGLVAHLNQAGPRGPDGNLWNAVSFQAEMAKLGQ